MHNEILNVCRVCGYRPEVPPWGLDGETPSWEICPSCGVEFGYEDVSAESVRRYRAKWRASGNHWTDAAVPADGMTVEDRLQRVPEEYR